MKKIVIIVSAVLLMVSCKPEAPKDYVTLSGTITNPNSDSLIVAQRQILKTIKVNEDGTFSDTLKLNPGTYVLFDGAEQTMVYLKNGFDLNIKVNTDEFDETLTYTGSGAQYNNYLASVALLQQTVLEDEAMFQLEKPKFDEKVKEINSKFQNLLAEAKIIDTAFVATQKKQINGLTGYLDGSYTEKQYLLTVLAEGKSSPKFEDYENFKGGTTSLDDLKGKYVYVDVWATWCGPCKREIPFLKEVEKAYHGKNIEFVSISIDVAKDHGKWKEMVAEKELGGIQLFADNNWNSDFVKAYQISGIPRFLLIDPDGNIVSSNAPRPSSKELIALFDELKI